MDRIESKADADALARSMLDDIALRNVATPAYLICQARDEFQARVAPPLHGVFEGMLPGYGWEWAADGLQADDDPVSPDDLVRAGVPRPHKRLARFFTTLTIVALVGGCLYLFGSGFYDLHGRTLVKAIALDRPGASVGMPIELAAGSETYVMVAYDSSSWSGRNTMVLDVEVRRGDDAVAHTSCVGFRARGSGSATLGLRHDSDCDFVVPAGGADFVQFSTHLTSPGHRLSIEGLEIQLRK